MACCGETQPDTAEALRGRSFGLTTKVELILNLKTAKSLGLTFPNTLGRADEVIE